MIDLRGLALPALVFSNNTKIIFNKNKCGGACPLLSLKALNRYIFYKFRCSVRDTSSKFKARPGFRPEKFSCLLIHLQIKPPL